MKLLYNLKSSNISMQGTCEVCGASNVEVKQTKTDDGQTKNACNQCA
jgi:hypothetical protein